jgi:CTP:molybdopterin cytidylyltransferase MocA
MREIILRDEERVRYIDLRDEGVLFDMDTREDYRRMLERINHG